MTEDASGTGGGRLDRRGFLGGAAALGAAGLLGGRPTAAVAQGREGPDGTLPRRGEFVIRRAHVLSLDPGIGDLPRGDVHVRSGRIVAVGRRLRAGGQEIDGRGTIVMPGLVDTHWHMWTALHRSMAGAHGKPENGYFPLNLRLGAQYRPRDIERGVRLALAEALTAGITTVHDWSHNIRGPEYADANLRAHAEAGLRGRFSYGTPQGHPATETLDLEDLERVQREWFATRRAGLMGLGVAGRPPGVAAPEVYRAEFQAAQRLGLPVSYHANSNRAQGQAAMIRTLGEEGMLSARTQLIHALYTTPEERALVVSSGASVSTSPWSELLVGYGVTPVRDLEAAGVRLTLSVDTLPLTGNADLFSIMKLALGLHRGEAENEFSLTARRVLEMATIDGARSLGLDDVTGSLTPGKRADLIMVRTDDVNIAPPSPDPANTIVLAAQPSNVDTVVVDGRILKRDGRLTAMDTRTVVREASRSIAAILERAAAAPATGTAARRTAHPAMCCD